MTGQTDDASTHDYALLLANGFLEAEVWTRNEEEFLINSRMIRAHKTTCVSERRQLYIGLA
jgi:hypothetical protein